MLLTKSGKKVLKMKEKTVGNNNDNENAAGTRYNNNAFYVHTGSIFIETPP